ncbi:UbiA-domain-containing protein [Massarina eburnea CBS 473.64]|uniref:UbiA-domain-containing protein n=1 Tax=Massarina eburnea CBS 473.64 TaxID=1395130 RepID=A0A6A6RZY6_9PLEO|nr:UbiA-domain-containing protein [Massarina eburnea CBS 473.64]
MSATETIHRRPNGKIQTTVNGKGANGTSNKPPPTRFDGVTTGSWVSLFPPGVIPYIQLARLSPPVPLLLIFFPHLFGLLHASITLSSPLPHLLSISAVLFVGSFFLSNAIHGWNDLIDAPIDAQIPRTAKRPIPRGAITERQAFVFTAVNAVIGFALFGTGWLPTETAWASIPSTVANFYYPFSKRHTHFPQVVLGVALQWAVVVGSSALGVHKAWKDTSVQALFAASLLWTVVYDTVYGFQDYDMDIKIGVKSTAVLIGRTWGKTILWLLSNIVVGLLVAAGWYAGIRGAVYYVVAAGGSFASLNLMMAMVDLSEPDSCSWWFTYGFWGPAIGISTGLLGEYVLA